MSNRTSLLRTAQVLSIGAAVTLASAALAAPASAATLNVACNETALRNAITTANTTPGADTLNLFPACVYRLTTELPSVTSQVVVNGGGATLTRQSGTFRILTVDGGNVTLRTAVVSNGDATGSSVQIGAGGGIVVTGNGTLAANAVVIRNNNADLGGGVRVINGSQATFTASTVTGNTAGTAGGGIANSGTLTVNASNLVSNTAPNGGGLANGVPAAGGGTSTVIASNISNNVSPAAGPGGIYNNGGTVNLLATRVVSNTPNNCGNSPTPVPGCFN